MDVKTQLLLGVKSIFWATRPNRRSFFAHEFLLSMCPIVILKEPILFNFFGFLATNIIKGQSAGGFLRSEAY